MEQKEKRYRLLLLILILITVISMGVTVWALFFRGPAQKPAPDYAPPDIEQNAQPMPDQNTSKLESPGGGGAIGVEYEPQMTVDLSEKALMFLYVNPERSTRNVAVEIYAGDRLIARSGIIKPGFRLQHLPLEDGAETLREGVYSGKMLLLSYHPQSGEKEMLNTECAVTITVQK